jgi:hypothetical protein
LQVTRLLLSGRDSLDQAIQKVRLASLGIPTVCTVRRAHACRDISLKGMITEPDWPLQFMEKREEIIKEEAGSHHPGPQ